MKDFYFEIPGRAVAKQRPRATGFTGANGHAQGRIYTPAKTAHYENFVALCFQAARRHARLDPVPLNCPVTVDVVAYFAIPKTMPKYMREKLASEREFYPKKPDSDNILKSVLDGLNGIAYEDDKLVVGCSVQKYYGTYERTEVTIRARRA